MMRFTAFAEIQLNPSMRDIGDGVAEAQPFHTHTHRVYTSVWVPRNTHPQRMSLDIPPIPFMSGFNRFSRKAVKRI